MTGYLIHYGISGQKWGIRRFQNEDGTLTEEGKRRYYDSMTDRQKKLFNRMSGKNQNRLIQKMQQGMSYTGATKAINDEYRRKVKTVLGIAAGVTLAGVAAWLGYKASGAIQARSRGALEFTRRQLEREARPFFNTGNGLHTAKAQAVTDAILSKSDSLTRRKAVSEFIRNKGKVAYDKNMFDNVILEKGWASNVRTLRDAGAGLDIILRR